jgi:hypothetical protein
VSRGPTNVKSLITIEDKSWPVGGARNLRLAGHDRLDRNFYLIHEIIETSGHDGITAGIN